MRSIICKVCNTRMWDDDDGVVYCPSCGWEAGTPINDDTLTQGDSWLTE